MVRSNILIIALLLITSVAFILLKQKEENRLITLMETEKLELQNRVTDSLSIAEKIDLQLTLKQRDQLANLWVHFKPYTPISGSTQNWFSHQSFSQNPEKDSLLATFNQKGEVGLVSNYIGKKSLSHFKIQLKIGENVYDSAHIIQPNPSLQLANTIQIHESLYFNTDSAKNLIEKIAINAEANIEVRLIGKSAYTSFLLTKEDKNAFKETWEIINLLSV